MNEESDIESRVYLGVRHTADPGQCNSDLAARLGYGYWLDDTFDPEPYANLDFAGDCRIVDGLVWQVTDNLRNIAQDSRSNNNPNNLTRKNVFRTGPVWTLRLGPVDQISFAAEYENTEFSEPEETDGERYIGTVAFKHFFSSSFSGGVMASRDEAELDTEEEIDRETLSLTFGKEWAATSLNGSAGVSEIETTLNDTSRSTDGFVGNLEVTRQVNPTTEIALEASRELTDATSDFDIRFGEFVFSQEQTGAVEVSAVRLRTATEFSAGSSLGLTAFASRSDYIDFGTEEESVGYNVSYRRPITAQVTATLGGGYNYLTYSDDNTADVLYRLNAGLDFQLSRKLTLVSTIGHGQRDSEISTREFVENWVLLGLNYQFL
ncbi:outer membrane beta-barrel protein [uncultured Marinobacter sp.]|uniref:outer membrane beta-barrel protein n=1 Tax=uncultured Marinobacter sp. TaxID=187379 RepID=UPI002619B850|nr:outer membrane beta-barrel protein [uncultured Marinobacter sp.]